MTLKVIHIQPSFWDREKEYTLLKVFDMGDVSKDTEFGDNLGVTLSRRKRRTGRRK